jgi:hypothetical protein
LAYPHNWHQYIALATRFREAVEASPGSARRSTAETNVQPDGDDGMMATSCARCCSSRLRAIWVHALNANPAEPGHSFAEYLRRLVAQDLGEPKPKAEISL